MSGPATKPSSTPLLDEWHAGSDCQRSVVFGDGGHPTTRLATQAIVEALLERRRGASFLDAGSGTGTLSACAAALGAEVTAVDRDPQASAQTAARVPNASVITGELSTVLATLARERSFDVVVANIAEPELPRLAGDLIRVARASGVVIATGFLLSRVSHIRKQFDKCGPLRVAAFRGYAILRFARGPIS